MGGPDPEYVVVTVGPYGKLTGVVGNAIKKEKQENNNYQNQNTR